MRHLDASAGDFGINVESPYPVACTLHYRGEQIARFNHHDLRDLEHVVAQAIRKARAKLGKDKDEV